MHHARDISFVWTDPSGNSHICEGRAPVIGELLVWTLCDLDIAEFEQIATGEASTTTCLKCKAALAVLAKRHGALR
jgi:hypothetical protein